MSALTICAIVSSAYGLHFDDDFKQGIGNWEKVGPGAVSAVEGKLRIQGVKPAFAIWQEVRKSLVSRKRKVVARVRLADNGLLT